jgi:Spy/CpxP family protein refolding chaperone
MLSVFTFAEHGHGQGPREMQEGQRINFQDRVKEFLNLTDKQFEKLEALKMKLDKESQKLRLKIQKENITIKELLLEDKIDYAKIKSVLKKINDLELQMKYKKFDHLKQVEEILKPEQFEKFKLHFLDANKARKKAMIRKAVKKRVKEAKSKR